MPNISEQFQDERESIEARREEVLTLIKAVHAKMLTLVEAAKAEIRADFEAMRGHLLTTVTR